MFASQQYDQDLSSGDFGVNRSSFPPKPPELLLSQSYIPQDILAKLDELDPRAITLDDLRIIGAEYFRNNPGEVGDIINDLKRYGDNPHFRATYLIDLAFNKVIPELESEYRLNTFDGIDEFLKLLSSSQTEPSTQVIQAFGQSAKLLNCIRTIYSHLFNSTQPDANMVHIAFSLVPLIIHPEGLGLQIAGGFSPFVNFINNIVGSSNR
jgi:hypothetical protein